MSQGFSSSKPKQTPRCHATRTLQIELHLPARTHLRNNTVYISTHRDKAEATIKGEDERRESPIYGRKRRRGATDGKKAGTATRAHVPHETSGRGRLRGRPVRQGGRRGVQAPRPSGERDTECRWARGGSGDPAEDRAPSVHRRPRCRYNRPILHTVTTAAAATATYVRVSVYMCMELF